MMRIDEGIKTYVEGKRDYGGMLLPCPFCGSAGKIEHKSGLDSWIVQCSNNQCPASYMIGWDYETQEEAAEAWNRRVKNDPC